MAILSFMVLQYWIVLEYLEKHIEEKKITMHSI